jgi:phosphoesterase RecJ-like protein
MNKVNNKYIEEILEKYKSEFNAIYEKILSYDKIAIFTHVRPDFDALGSQYGLGTFLKENFKNKEIKIVGNNSTNYSPSLYPYTDEVSDDFFSDALGIAVDCANLDRISDKRIKTVKEIIKIDHHPNLEPFGNINLVDEEMSSIGEFVTLFLLSLGHNYIISKETAKYLYSAVVGDTGRFRYASTAISTFAVSEVLLATGLDFVNDVYTKMYAQTLGDLNVTGYILSHYKLTPNGFAYYYFDDKTLQNLGVNAEQAKEFVNVLSGVEQIQVWAAICEDAKENVIRVSLRSASKPINQIANKWRGGGHINSSGATLLSKDEIPLLVKDVDDYLKNN